MDEFYYRETFMNVPKSNVAVETLQFSLFQRPMHHELFNIYAERKFQTEKYESIIWITGCSHVAGVFTDRLALSEVVAGPKQLLPQRGLIERFHFRGPKTHKCTLSKGVSYMTDFQVEKMNSDLYRQTHKDLEKFARNRGIFVKFKPQGEQQLQPFSYIDYEARKDELHIHTFSAFPDQLTMIKTQSLFDFH